MELSKAKLKILENGIVYENDENNEYENLDSDPEMMDSDSEKY